MLSIGKLTAGAEDYYLGAVARGAEEYYDHAGEIPGRWTGAAAGTLGLAGDVDPEQLRGVLSGAHPHNGEPLAQTARRVPGFDLTFSAPKSVSLLYAFGTPEQSEHAVEAHEAAVEGALGYLERAACTVRRGHAGEIELPATGFVAAKFRHRTSRAGDPQMHTHVLVANLGFGPDGRWSALRGRHLYTHARTAGFLYQSLVRYELTERLGTRWHPAARGVADIAGIDSAVLRAFSQRRVEIEAALAERDLSSASAAQVATLATRNGKQPALDDASLRALWVRRASDLGLDPGTMARVAPGPRQPACMRVDPDELASALTMQHSTFDRRDVLRGVAERALDGAHIVQLDAAADAFLSNDRVVPLGRGRFTTREMLEVEQRLVDGACRRSARRVGVVAASTVESALVSSPGLSDEQRRLVRVVTGSGRSIDVVVGAPGSGKTYALATAHRAWSASGHTVVGAALAARAARELEAGSGIPSSTLHRLLADLEENRGRLPARSVVVVDEAGMVGTRQLAQLLAHAQIADAKVVLVGDPRQLPEIEAGGAFAGLARRLPTVHLNENRRQHDPIERRALDELRGDRVAHAVDLLAKHGRVTVTPTRSDARSAMVKDWLAASQRGDDVVMLTTRHREVDELNRAARQALVAAGAVRPQGVHFGGREFAIGDRVMTLSNWHRHQITNGERGTISGLAGATATVTFDGGHVRTLPASYLQEGHLTHAYAMTVHKAQGATVDRALVLADTTLFREAGYTAMSRGREENHLYVVAEPDRDEAAHHQPPPPESPIKELARELSHSHAKDMAIEAPEPDFALEL